MRAPTHHPTTFHVVVFVNVRIRVVPPSSISRLLVRPVLFVDLVVDRLEQVEPSAQNQTQNRDRDS